MAKINNSGEGLMSRLTAKEVNGVWAGITMAWDENYRFDEEIYARNIKGMIDAGVHGIYTTGSTGEFYAIEYDEFCSMVDIQSHLCGEANMPLQIGCCSDSTSKTIKLLEYAAGKKQVGAVQVNIPYWMQLSDRELLQFFKDLTSACPDMPLIHYNIPRAKRFLGGDDYVSLLEAGVNLIGVKYTFAGSHFGDLQDAMIKTPDLSYFVAETFLASAMQLGARGTYSSLIGTDPNFMLNFYKHAKEGNWDKASVGQKFIADGTDMPEGFCGWAWSDIEKIVLTLSRGGNFRGVPKGTFVTCCTDGYRPVIFKLERLKN